MGRILRQRRFDWRGSELAVSFYGLTPNPARGADGLPPGPGAVETYFREYLPAVEVKVGAPCNLNCAYCYTPRSRMVMEPFGAVARKIERAAAVGVPTLLLMGDGEVSVRPDGPEIVRAARDHGFARIQLLTNGLVFYRRKLLEKYVESGLTAVMVHASSSQPKLYEGLARRRGAQGILAEALRNLTLFPQLSVVLFSVISRRNLDRLGETVESFAEYGARAGFRNFHHDLGAYCVFSKDTNAWAARRALMPNLGAVSAAVRRLMEGSSTELPLLYVGIPLCLMGGLEVHSFDRYALQARFLRPSKNGSGAGGYRVDHSARERVFAKASTCAGCRYDALCPGFARAYSAAYGFREFQPVAG